MLWVEIMVFLADCIPHGDVSVGFEVVTSCDWDNFVKVMMCVSR